MKKIFFVVIAVLTIMMLSGCKEEIPGNTVYSASDMPGKTVGVLAGTASASYMEIYGGSMSIEQYDDVETMAAALKNGSLDCVIADVETFEEMERYSSQLERLEEYFIDRQYCFVVSEDNTVLLENLNTALQALKDQGTIQRITSGRFESDYIGTESTSADIATETVTVAIDPKFVPYAFYDDEGRIVGMEAQVVRAVCRYLGLEPEFIVTDSSMLVYTASSGKVAFAVGRLTNNGEDPSVVYTEPYFNSQQVIVVRE